LDSGVQLNLLGNTPAAVLQLRAFIIIIIIIIIKVLQLRAL
jgi:hypothetical protein